MWLRSELTPRAMLVLGHTAWEGGGAKSWLRLKALPTAEGGSSDPALPRLPEPEELTADEAGPVEHVVPFAQLLGTEWSRPQRVATPGGDSPRGCGSSGGRNCVTSQREAKAAAAAQGGVGAEEGAEGAGGGLVGSSAKAQRPSSAPPFPDHVDLAELRRALEEAFRSHFRADVERDEVGLGALQAEGISITPDEYEAGAEWRCACALATHGALVRLGYATRRGALLHFAAAALRGEWSRAVPAEAEARLGEGRVARGEATTCSPTGDGPAASRGDRPPPCDEGAAARLRDEEPAGCIPHGVVLHSGGAAGSGGSFVTAPTAATVGNDSPHVGPGSKRKRAADADTEVARHCRAERRQREAAAPGEVVVPASHRAAVLEGLRRVLVKEGGDPEEWWERNGAGGPFPFEAELPALRGLRGGELYREEGKATSRSP